MKLVEVEWLDYCSMAGSTWNSMEDVKRLAIIHMESVGYVISDTKDELVLASHISKDLENCSGDMCIMKKAITKMKVLRKK